MDHASETLHAILRSIVDAIITIDGEGTITTVNAATESLLGYKPTELIGRNVSTLMPEPFGDRDGYLSEYRNSDVPKIIGTGREVKAKKKNGEEMPIELTVGQIRGGDDPSFVVILRDISDRTAVSHELEINHSMLDAISGIQSQFIRDGDTKTAFDSLLTQILQITGSEYGFIGEVKRREDGQPYLLTHAITNIAWNDETRAFYDENAPAGMEFSNLKTLFGSVIANGKPVIANEPSTDPRSGGLPPGHPALNAFLGVPFSIGDRMVGMLGIANREGGYQESDIQMIGPLLATCANMVGSVESTKQRIEAEEALREANEQLAVTIDQMSQRNEQVLLLSELEELLQACEILEEAYEVIAYISKRLFPGLSGAIFGFDNNTKSLKLFNHWGPGHISSVFSSSDCMGIRRGRPHVSSGEDAPLNCRHSDTREFATLCVPLIGRSQTFGVLELLAPKTSSEIAAISQIEDIQEVAITVSRRIAVTFANIRLSQNLKQQSLRDPLTNLYNRRHMNDALDRELHRVHRNPDSRLSVIQFDIDHFKQINDKFGHSTGDALLSEFSDILRDCSRGSDVACRIGGEEFLLVLPDCPADSAIKRADKIRQRFMELVCVSHGNEVRDVTVSAGVATAPDCATSSGGLIRAADRALYEAKSTGRNRVVAATKLVQPEPDMTMSMVIPRIELEPPEPDANPAAE